MFRLLSLLSNYRNFLFFLVLEIVAFYLIVRYNDHQRHRVGDGLLEFSSGMHDNRSKVVGFFRLGRANDQLMEENIALRQELLDARRQVDSLQGLMGTDSLRHWEEKPMPGGARFKFFPCRVIRNTTNQNYNYITIDKGSNDGVTDGMGVVSPQGIVGKVIQTSKNYSLVLSALNVSFSLLVKAVPKDNPNADGHVGIYAWDGSDTYSANLGFIPETVDLDTSYYVVTSGYKSSFPEGYMVGSISEKQESQDGYHKAIISLATDFHALGNVYLVAASHKETLDSLELSLPRDK